MRPSRRILRPVLVSLCVLALIGSLAKASEEALRQANEAYDKQDFSTAAKLFRELADGGSAEAALKLGVLYQFGRGVDQDYNEALTLFRKAAQQGNNEAKSRAAALEKRLDRNRQRQAQVAAQTLPQANSGAAVLNWTGAVAAGLAQANAKTGGAQYTEVNATGSNLNYSGPYDREVRYLLAHSPQKWKTPSCPTCNDGVPPYDTNRPPPMPCMRDKYVYAALASAWAAESHEVVGNHPAAVDNAKMVRDNLNNANSLCSNAPVVGRPMECTTRGVWDCPGW